MHLGAFKGSLQDGKKNRGLVNRICSDLQIGQNKFSMIFFHYGQGPYFKFF